MGNYEITEYTRKRASELGVTVRLSTKATKKLDVLRDGKVIASIGGLGYADYPTFIKSHGVKYANERRKAFYQRHAKSISVKHSPAWFAAELLW